MKKMLFSLVLAFVLVTNTNANITVTLAGLNPPVSQYIAGAQDVPIAMFNFNRQGGDSVITSITFGRLGFSFDDVVTKLYMYRNGTFIGTGMFINGQAVFSGLHLGLSTGGAMVEIRADVNSNTNSTSFGMSVDRLSTLITPNQNVNLWANIHFISTASVVFSSNVYPTGWQVNSGNNWPQVIFGTNFSVSTVNVGFDTVSFTLSGTLPVQSLSNFVLYIGFYSFVSPVVQGNRVTFIIDNSSGIIFSPSLYNLTLEASIASCATGTLQVSINDQSDVKYHASILWQLYTASGTYPRMSNMEFMPCYQYVIDKQNAGTNSYFAKIFLQNITYSPADPNPTAYVYLWDWFNTNFNDSLIFSWNGSAYEGIVHFASLEAVHQYNWNVDAIINGTHYPQWMTNQGSFYFTTKVCYQASPGQVKTGSVGTNFAVVGGQIQYPHPANGSEWFSTLYVLNEDKQNSFPSQDSSVVFGSMWQTPQAITDTAKGAYVVKNLDSCTNYSFWFEWRQPCGGIFKSEIGKFRTLGSCRTEEKQLFIFPNPATNNITIRFDYGRDVNKEIGIYNMNGQLVKKITITNSQQQIDISSLPPGMYIVRDFREKNFQYTSSVEGKFIKL